MIRSNVRSRIIPWDSKREISSRIPIIVIGTILVLPMGVGLGILLSKALSALTTPSVMAVLSALPPASIWGLVIGVVSIMLIVILRQYEIAAAVVLAISLYADWYLGLTFVAPILTLVLLLIFFLGRS